MTTTTLHGSYSLSTFSHGRRQVDNNRIFSVEVYGEDGDYDCFEIMASNKQEAQTIAEQKAQNMMTDICYVAIYEM